VPTDVGSDNHMITSTHDKCYVLVDIGHRELEGITNVGREWEASSAAINTIHETSFLGLQFTLFKLHFLTTYIIKKK
jgi:hypothetical protein